MTDKKKTLSELYAPKSVASKEFVALHKVDKIDKRMYKDNARFDGSNVKTFNRSGKRMGYNPGEDEKVYGVGGATPGPNDANPAPKDGSTLYPSGTFAKEDIELTDDDIDMLLDILDTVLGEEIELDETSARDFARGVNPNHPATTIKNPETHANYSKVAVDKAIQSSNRGGRKIGGAEAKKIHALLKGWRK